jgi:hypothetical protein
MLCSQSLRAAPFIRYADLGSTTIVLRSHFAPFYRRNGRERYRTMTLEPGEFIRRFLLHVLPKGFHRIRHYGLLASAGRKDNIARARELLAAPQPKAECNEAGADAAAPSDWRPPCPCRMIIIETFECGGGRARAPPWMRAS